MQLVLTSWQWTWQAFSADATDFLYSKKKHFHKFLMFCLLFFIMPCELVRRHIPSCSSKFDVKIENLEILDVGDYNISETIKTTETWVAPFGSVTLPVGHSKNETRISLTVSEIFDRKREPWTRYFFILIMPCELVRRHIPSCSSKFSSKWKILKFLMLATRISQKR